MTTARCSVKERDNKWGTAYVTSHRFWKNWEVNKNGHICMHAKMRYMIHFCVFNGFAGLCCGCIGLCGNDMCDLSSHLLLGFNTLYELNLWPTSPLASVYMSYLHITAAVRNASWNKCVRTDRICSTWMRLVCLQYVFVPVGLYLYTVLVIIHIQ